MPTSRGKSTPAVIFPARGTPPDAQGYPHYERLGAANRRYRAAYETLLKERRAERQKFLAACASAGSGGKSRWTRHFANVSRAFAAALGLKQTSKPSAPAQRYDRATFVGRTSAIIPEASVSLNFKWMKLNGASWENSDFELLVLRSFDAPGPHPAVLLIPDAGAGLIGGESPEAAARGWGERLAAAGFVVGIPRLPAFERFCSTHNKKRIVEGAAALGEIAFESAQALAALLQQPGVDGKRGWLAGRGLGALAAIFLGALDDRVAGVLADAPTAWGTAGDPHALLVGGAHCITDLYELTAMLAPKPLALIDQPAATTAANRISTASVRAMKQAAQPAYRLHRQSKRLEVFPAGRAAKAPAWMRAHDDATRASFKEGIARADKPMRRFATWRFSTAEDWRRAARRLRREYPNAIGIPDDALPLKVVKMSRADLPEYSRTEYHIQTGEHTWSNTILMQPRSVSGPRPTILYLPGSGSDVAKQELQFAHEVIAFGWNACVIDARAALYPFHPGIAEGRAILPQGLHDLRCCCNWLFEQTCVDKKRVATMGVSQGGTHSWMLTAVESRIAATAPVCGICTYASLDQLVTDWYGGGHSSFFDSHSIYYFPPALLQLAEQQDVCALIAPRPFMFVGATHDNCFPVDGMRMAAEDIRHVYRLLGAEDKFVYYEFDGPHSMPEHSRKAAYSFFRKVFNKIH